MMFRRLKTRLARRWMSESLAEGLRYPQSSVTDWGMDKRYPGVRFSFSASRL